MIGANSQNIERLPLVNRAPDQIAWVVPDLEAAVQRMGMVLQVPRWNVWDYGPDYVPFRRFHGEPSDYSQVVAMPEFGSTVEIIQPVVGPSIYSDFIEDRGPGLHHVGYYVPDLEPIRARFAQLGYEEILSGGGHGVDGDGMYVFWDLRDVVGSYVEAITPGARRHPPHWTIDVDLGA